MTPWISLDDAIENVIFYYTNYTQNVTNTVASILTPRGVAFCLTLAGTMYDMYKFTLNTTGRVLGSVIDEFSTSGNLWIFFGDETRPIPYKVCATPPQGVSWVYNKISNTLFERQSGPVGSSTPFSYLETNPCKLPWIMTVATTYGVDESGNNVKTAEYYLDEWLSDFFVDIHEKTDIPPRILLSCWALNSGIWFENDRVVRLEVMDKNAETYVFENINSELNSSDMPRWRNVLNLTHTEESAT